MLEHVKGQSLHELCSSEKGLKWMQKNRKVVVDQCAQIVVDLIKQGIGHGDLHSANIIVSKKKGKPHLTMIDFSLAETTNEQMKQQSRGESRIALYLEQDTKVFLKDISETIYEGGLYSTHYKPDRRTKQFQKAVMKRIEKKIKEQM